MCVSARISLNFIHFNSIQFTAIQSLDLWIRCMLTLCTLCMYCDAYFDKHHHHQIKRDGGNDADDSEWIEKTERTQKRKKFNYTLVLHPQHISLSFLRFSFFVLFCCSSSYPQKFLPFDLLCCMHTQHNNRAHTHIERAREILETQQKEKRHIVPGRGKAKRSRAKNRVKKIHAIIV